MLKLLGITGCFCCKSKPNIVHPTMKESTPNRKERARIVPTLEQFDNPFQKSESNTTTPKAGSFDEQNYFEWKKGEESVVLDRYFMGRSNERSPNTAKSVVIMENNSSSFLNLSPTRIDNSPDRYTTKSIVALDKSELTSESNLMKIINTIRDKPVKIRFKMEAKFIKAYAPKKTPKKYLVAESWMEAYSKYLHGERSEVLGPIDNRELKKRLLLKTTKTGSLFSVNEVIWFFFKTLYGASPEICHSNEPTSATTAPLKPRKPEKVKTEIFDEPVTPLRARTKQKSFTYSQKAALSDLNYCLKPLKMLQDDPSSAIGACFQLLLGIGDLLRCMEQERQLEIMNFRNSKFLRGFQDIIDAHLREQKFFSGASLKKTFGDQYNDGQYLDAYEFLKVYLAGMQSEFSPNLQTQETKTTEMGNTISSPTNFISMKDIFGGLVIETQKCLNCGKKIQTQKSTLHLSLPIVPTLTKTIDDCLSVFQKESEMESLQACERCKTEYRATKQSIVHKFSKYFVVHLQRFPEGPSGPKIEDFVHYLPENWKVKGSSEKETNIYSLSGVIAHEGRMDSGHYVCYTKRGEEWFMCDDEEVRKVHSKKIVLRDAYVLLYQRMN